MLCPCINLGDDVHVRIKFNEQLIVDLPLKRCAM